MDASQYKNYVLFLLFIKYASDKYGNSDDFAPPVTIPKRSSFKDMIGLKGNSNIGDLINKQIIQPLIDANSRLARTDFPDYNDQNKLGEGQAVVDRLTIWSAFSRSLNLTSQTIERKTTISSAMPMNTSCGTSLQRVAKARASSIPLPRATDHCQSDRHISEQHHREYHLPTTPPADQVRCCSKLLPRPPNISPLKARKWT